MSKLFLVGSSDNNTLGIVEHNHLPEEGEIVNLKAGENLTPLNAGAFLINGNYRVEGKRFYDDGDARIPWFPNLKLAR